MESDFIDDFIEEYKNQPCLWQGKSADFKNRKKRQEAYYKLIEVASKHGEHYNIERTKQKINNLRCAFRHQLKKYTESKNNKTGKEDTYCPKRRYFESLMFLLNEERPERIKQDTKERIEKETISLIEDSSENIETRTYAIQEPEENSKETTELIGQQIEEEVTIESHKENTVQIEVQCDEEVNLLWPRITSTPKSAETILHVAPGPNPIHVQPEPEQRHRTMSASSTSSQAQSENVSKKIKIDCSSTNFEKLLHLACSKANTASVDSHEDDFNIFGKMVAYKLRSMDTQQSIIAEKLITDILLEGQMKMLSYPVRSLPYRQEGQAFVISSVNLNGTAEAQVDRNTQYSTQTIQYSTANGSQL